ncbi:hypothetical protein D3C81_765290 [compost metagenome]
MHRRVHAADHDGLAIADANLGVYLVLPDRRHLGQGVEVVRFILGDLDGHDHPVVRGDLRRHLQRQRRFTEGHRRSAAATGFLIGHFGALEDPRGFLVGSHYLGLGNDFTVAGFLHGTELQVQQQVIAHQAQPNRRGGPFCTKVDKGVATAQHQTTS